MKIELKNLERMASLSEETHCYTATVYIDGKPAFHASNHGHGGCDLYHRVEGYTGPSEAEVNEYLASTRPVERHERDDGSFFEMKHCLEFEVGEQIDSILRQRILNRMLKNKIVVLVKDGERDALATYPAKFKPTAQNIAILQARGETVVNGTPELEARALALV